MARPRTHLTAEARDASKTAVKRKYTKTGKFRECQTRFKEKKGSSYFQDVRLRHKYGISLIERDAMLLSQGSGCAACGSLTAGHKHGWAVDHDHRTGRIRGILCQPCNMIAGHAEKRPARLAGLMSYLGFVGNDAEYAILSLPA